MKEGGTVRFKEFEVDPQRFQIAKNGAPVPLERRVYDLVVYLIEHRDRVVSKNELLASVWHQSTLSESAIARCVSAARKAFGDPGCIEAVYGRGYKWMIPIAAGGADATMCAVSSRRCIVGRELEFELVEKLIGRVASGQGGVCFVIGEAGIGKTRLLNAIRDDATRRRMRVVIGRCRETDGTPPYWPWAQIVQSLQERSRPLPNLVAQLLALTPEAGGAPAERAQASRFLAWEALAEFIAEEARRTPTAILIDDLHNADVGATMLLELVAERTSQAPLLLAASYRPLELERDATRRVSVERIVRSATPLALELHGFSLGETEEFLHIQTGLAPSADLVGRAHALTGGNPFFLSLVTPLLAAAGDGWEPRDLVRMLPGTVRSSIERQLATVSAQCRSLLEVAAVIGRVVPMGTAAATLGRDMKLIAEAVEEARNAGLVVEPGDPIPVFSFVHDLVREVVNEGISLHERSRLHLSVARTLEANAHAETPERLAEIAHHYANSVSDGGAEPAIGYAIRAARSDLGRFAYEGAAAHLTRAVALMDQMHIGNAQSLSDALVDLGTAELSSGNDGNAWAALGRAADLARNRKDIDMLVRIALTLTSNLHSSRMEYDPRLVSLLEELLAAKDLDRQDVRALLLSRFVFTLAWFPDQSKRSAFAREASDLASGIADPRVRGSVSAAMALGMDQPGDINERVRLAEQGLRFCETAGDFGMMQFAHIVCMLCLLEVGHLDAVRRHARLCRDLMHRLRARDPGSLAAPLAHLGLLAHIDARLHDFEEIRRQTQELATETADHFPASIAEVQQAFLLFEADRLTEAAGIIRRWANLVPDLQPWQCILTMILARAGKVPEVRLRLRTYVDNGFTLQPDWHWLYCVTLLADAAGTIRERQATAILYDRLAPYEDRCATVGAACIFLGSIHRHLGRLSDVLGRPSEAHAHFERAHAVHSSIGAKLMLAHSLCDHALFLERTPQVVGPGPAADIRVRATELADEIGSAYLQRRLASP